MHNIFNYTGDSDVIVVAKAPQCGSGQTPPARTDVARPSKSGGGVHVPTSVKNLKAMDKKERVKKDKAKQQEERKQRMEQRRKEKAEQAEEKRKNIEAKKLKQMSNPTPSVWPPVKYPLRSRGGN